MNAAPTTLEWFEDHQAEDWSDPVVVLAALAFAGAPPESLRLNPAA